MSGPSRCHCRSCTIRSLMGPAIVITVGILFLLHQTQGGRFFFGNTWPLLLLVIGSVQVASALAPRDGHVEPVAPGTLPPPPVPPQPPFAPPPTVPPQSPYSAEGQ
jgi:hypothetical protein